jgi:FtsP/CotA-like multicopper oxidase with cupredoxin domain
MSGWLRALLLAVALMVEHHRPDAPASTVTFPTEWFPTDPSGLPEAGRPQLLELAGGDILDLRVGPVAKRLGDTTVRMLAYNGSIPGPTLKVRQGSEIIVRVENQGDLDTTVHWHGLRLENKYDGVPHETQAPIPVGGRFTYRIQVPDPGLYWYHPHIREDYTQELGLYGNLLVVPADPTTGRRPTVNSFLPWTTCCWRTARSPRSAAARPAMRPWAASATSS